MARTAAFEDFEQATSQLRAFLKQECLPVEIVWVTPEDVCLFGKRILVRWPQEDQARERAFSDFLKGCQRGLGVELGVLCQIEEKVCCFIWIPRDEDEAGRHLMPRTLKFTHPLPVPHGLVVTNRVRWSITKWQSQLWDSRKNQLFHQE